MALWEMTVKQEVIAPELPIASDSIRAQSLDA
jgi:hypothetical protein